MLVADVLGIPKARVVMSRSDSDYELMRKHGLDPSFDGAMLQRIKAEMACNSGNLPLLREPCGSQAPSRRNPSKPALAPYS